MNNIIFESERLIFKEFKLTDANLIFQLNLDPEVTRFTGDPIHSLEQAEEVLKNIILPQYTLYGHGRWAVYLKSTNDFIGWCGLKYLTESGEIDLGYRCMKIFWNKGYASEAAKATVEYGLEILNLKCITGRAVPENIASIKILEKCGMEYIGLFEFHDHLAATYQIKNNSLPCTHKI